MRIHICVFTRVSMQKGIYVFGNKLHLFFTKVAILKGYGIKGALKLVEYSFDDILTFPLFFA